MTTTTDVVAEPITDLTPEQLKARQRVAQVKRLGVLNMLNKARWAFDRAPTEQNLRMLRLYTIQVLELEHEMCGWSVRLTEVEDAS